MYPLTLEDANRLALPCLFEGRCPHLGTIDPENPEVVAIAIIFGEGKFGETTQHQVSCTRHTLTGDIINPCCECPGRVLQVA